MGELREMDVTFRTLAIWCDGRAGFRTHPAGIVCATSLANPIRVCLEPEFGANNFLAIRHRIVECRKQHSSALDHQARQRFLCGLESWMEEALSGSPRIASVA